MTDKENSDKVSGDIYLKHRLAYGSAMEAHGQKGSLVMQAVKAAEGEQVNTNAMRMAFRLRKMETVTAMQFLIDVMTYSIYERAPFMFQQDILLGNRSLNELLNTKPPSEEMVRLWTEEEWRQRGYNEGVAGHPVDNLNKMLKPGTAEYAAAMIGYEDGKGFRQRSQQLGVEAVTGGGARRGRKPKAKPGEAELPDKGIRPPVPEGKKMVDMIEVERLGSTAELANYFNEFVPDDKKVKRFESKAAGRSRLQKLYQEQISEVFKTDEAEEKARREAAAAEAEEQRQADEAVFDKPTEAGEEIADGDDENLTQILPGEYEP